MVRVSRNGFRYGSTVKLGLTTLTLTGTGIPKTPSNSNHFSQKCEISRDAYVAGTTLLPSRATSRTYELNLPGGEALTKAMTTFSKVGCIVLLALVKWYLSLEPSFKLFQAIFNHFLFFFFSL